MGFRVLALSGFFTAVFTGVGAVVGSIWGLEGAVKMGIAFFFFSLALDLFSYWYSPGFILKKYRAKPCNEKWLDEMVKKLARNAKVPKPKVYILPIDLPNSFATGRGKEYAVCLTEGLLSMNRGEIEGVISHELWHIANRDIFIQSVTAVISNVLLSTVVFAPLALLLTKLAISEEREYRADYYGSRFSRKPMDLANALSKMNEIARHNPMEGSLAFECLWIVNPFRREGFAGMLSTHPPTARRVKRLEDMVHEGMPEPPEATEV